MSLSREAHRFFSKHATSLLLHWAAHRNRNLGQVAPFPINPRKLLLANAGNLGDLVLFRHALGAVRASFPEAEIGLLVAPWGQEVWRSHPEIAHLHVIHPFKCRSHRDSLGGLLDYTLALPSFIEELRAPGYEAAIDFRMGFPMFALELYLAGIPRRLGFRSAPLGALFTAGLHRSWDRKHESLRHISLLEATERPILPGDPWELPLDEDFSHRQFLDSHRLKPSHYRVFHMSSSRMAKEWPVEHWVELGRALSAKGVRVVFTGCGPRDSARILIVSKEVPGSVDACGVGGWQGFMHLIQDAEMVYSVDTVAGHLAAALNTPCVSIFGGTSDPNEWKPRGERVQVVHRQARCFPCIESSGCPELSCLNQLSYRNVYDSGNHLLSKDMVTRIA